VSERREAGIPPSSEQETQAEPTGGEAEPEATNEGGPSGPAPEAPRAGHMTATAAPLLDARDIYAGYLPGIDILLGCSLEVYAGEIVGIIGPNGAGKSTLLKAVFGLVPVRRGTVHLRGESIASLRAHELVERGVGYVPQVRNVFSTLTVDDNLRMGSYLRPRAYRERRDDILTLLPRLGERINLRAGSLSGGERQMLAMARALMMRPTVLLLDEPSAGLSPMMQDDVFERIGDINHAGVSVLIVEQNARHCLEIAHRAYVLDQGRNAYSGTGEELLADPNVVQLYLGTLAQS
jgi:branched-chain amino acid transport system ATP-binding protein